MLEINSLRHSSDGSPWALISTSSNLTLETLQYSIMGSPWYGYTETTETTNSNFLIWFLT